MTKRKETRRDRMRRLCPHNAVRLLESPPGEPRVYECLDCGAEVRREKR